MHKTQRTEALAGRITPEMELVAKQEFLPAETIREEIARGRLVIPANRIHLKRASFRRESGFPAGQKSTQISATLLFRAIWAVNWRKSAVPFHVVPTR